MDEIRKMTLVKCLYVPTLKFLSAKYAAKRQLQRLGMSPEQADESIEAFLELMAEANEEATEDTDKMLGLPGQIKEV